MGKLADLAAVKVASSEHFTYIPPDSAFGAGRILVKPNLGYAAPPPATVSLPVLVQVLRGLRRASPKARILIVEGAAGKTPVEEIFEKSGIQGVLDEEMRAAPMSQLLNKDYPNRSPQPVKYEAMHAPEYLEEFDCVISVGAFKKTMLNGEPLISASLKNLYGFFPPERYSARNPDARGKLHRPSVPLVLQDIYFSIGHHIDGAVVDLTEKYVSPDERADRVRDVAQPVGKVVWGDDMLAVDEMACQLAGEEAASYIAPIRRLREQLRG